jgi:hypothetical protein
MSKVLPSWSVMQHFSDVVRAGAVVAFEKLHSLAADSAASKAGVAALLFNSMDYFILRVAFVLSWPPTHSGFRLQEMPLAARPWRTANRIATPMKTLPNVDVTFSTNCNAPRRPEEFILHRQSRISTLFRFGVACRPIELTWILLPELAEQTNLLRWQQRAC